MVPQVVDDVFRKFLWKLSRGGLDISPFLEKFNFLVERGSQPGEKRGFLRVALGAMFVKVSTETESESMAYLHATHDE